MNCLHTTRWSLLRSWLAVCWLAVPSCLTLANEPSPGEAIYRQQCASCHGPQGEGTSQYDERLTGELSVEALSAYIHEWMPEEAPEECTDEEARQVAAYIHDAFYSPIAQARIAPPRVELSRLTVGQHRQVLADLVAGADVAAAWDDQRGLTAEYFNSGRRIRDEDRVLERIEDNVQFDHGKQPPPIDNLSAEEFAGRWQGGVHAPETGEYEFVLKTKNGARLWVNDDETALIDAWVRSGEESEYRETRFLLGGRVYPIRVEFFKSKQDPEAGLTLSWRRPKRVEEVVAPDYLSPHKFPETFVMQTDFPPDDRSQGYERGTSISKQWDQAATYAAIEAAGYVVERLHEVPGYKQDDSRRGDALRAYCRQFAERAFRGPIDDELAAVLIDRHFDQANSPEQATKLALILILKSPRFLYVDLHDHPHDSHAVAARLALGLWDALPDEALRKAADADELQTREQVAAHARRMLNHPLAAAKMLAFFHEWLNLHHMQHIAKDAEQFPEFNEQVLSDLRESLDRQLNAIMWSEASDFRQLLVSDALYFNGSLAKLYGAELPPEADFQPIQLDAQRRSGVLTHPLLMTGFAHREQTSPIHRGVFLARNVLGRRLRPPQEDFDVISPDLHPEMTTRERVALQTEAKACQQCHAMINPLGFSLEHFDAMGRFRSEDNKKPVDASGEYRTIDGQPVAFDSAVELAQFAAESTEAQQAFIERLFHHVAKQPLLAYGETKPSELREQFVREEFNMQTLLVEIATTMAFEVESP